MDEFARSLFENAVVKEQVAQRLYLRLKEKTSNPLLKELFEKLYQEERIHENLLKKKNLNVLKIVNQSELRNLNILKDTKKENLDFKTAREINEALDLAINEEEKAFQDYSVILNHLPFGESRDALKEIAIQEKRHKTLLQKVKLDFNKNDWEVI